MTLMSLNENYIMMMQELRLVVSMSLQIHCCLTLLKSQNNLWQLLQWSWFVLTTVHQVDRVTLSRTVKSMQNWHKSALDLSQKEVWVYVNWCKNYPTAPLNYYLSKPFCWWVTRDIWGCTELDEHYEVKKQYNQVCFRAQVKNMALGSKPACEVSQSGLQCFL